jgi:hypothetical protein
MKRKLMLVALLLAFPGAAALAATAGEITHLSGILSVKHADGSSKILSVKSLVNEGDVLATEADTYARIKFVDGGEVVLRPNTQLKVESYRYEEAKPQNDNVLLNMLKGGLRAVTGLIGKRNQDRVAYQTPTATIGIRGTHHGQLHCNNDCGGIPTPSGQPPANGLHVDVASGAVSITNAAGSFTFNAGQFAFVPSAMLAPVLVPSEQGIRITMPGAVAANKGGGDGIGKGNSDQCTVD